MSSMRLCLWTSAQACIRRIGLPRSATTLCNPLCKQAHACLHKSLTAYSTVLILMTCTKLILMTCTKLSGGAMLVKLSSVTLQTGLRSHARSDLLTDIFMQVNPLGKVPALQDGDLTLVRPASAPAIIECSRYVLLIPISLGAVLFSVLQQCGR